jgi:hypothetical protein
MLHRENPVLPAYEDGVGSLSTTTQTSTETVGKK